jgi:hypothetical protein
MLDSLFAFGLQLATKLLGMNKPSQKLEPALGELETEKAAKAAEEARKEVPK